VFGSREQTGMRNERKTTGSENECEGARDQDSPGGEIHTEYTGRIQINPWSGWGRHMDDCGRSTVDDRVGPESRCKALRVDEGGMYNK